MRPARVLAYARVSSAAQALGTSLQDQESAIAAYAKSRGLEVTRFYREAESAIHEKSERREQIKALTAEVRAGDLVLCDKIDRWSRDPEFSYRSIREILERKASFYAVGDQCDPSTPEGDTMLNFRVLFAREEHKRIKLRMVGTRHLLKGAGFYADGRYPYGYRRSLPKGTKGPDKNVLVQVPAEASVVRQLFEVSAGGASYRRAAVLVGLQEQRALKILHNRVYLGEVRQPDGSWVPGKHLPIVDVDLFTRANTATRDRRHGPQPGGGATSDWILRDVARCAHCDGVMSAAYGKGPGGSRQFYYRCYDRCTHKHVRVRDVEALALPLIAARLEELREELGGPASPVAAKADPSLGLPKLQRKRERFLEAYADEAMTKEELRAALAKVDAAVLAIRGEVAAQVRPAALADPQVRREVLKEVGVIARKWRNAPALTRRAIVVQLAVAARLAYGLAPVFIWKTAEELHMHSSPR